jgi:polyisoprenoid-binding protein YceI
MSVADGASGASVVPAGKWSVDAPRSSVAFAVKHMLVAKVNGHFLKFDGMLDIGSGAPRATGVVKAASIDTNEPVRDEHLRRSPDFFDAERYPEISFSSTRIDYLDGGRLRILGDLTMRGVTGEIELDAQPNNKRREAGSDERIELELRGELDRRDFGLTWNQVLDTGGALLGNKVKIVLEISAVKSEGADPWPGPVQPGQVVQGSTADIGNWGQTLGITNMATEVAAIVLATWALRRRLG